MANIEPNIVLTQRTRSEIFTHHFEWKITHFTGRPERPGQYIKSLEFSLGREADKYYLRFYPKGMAIDDDHMSLRLGFKSKEPSEVYIKGEVSVLTIHNEKKYSVTWIHQYLPGRVFRPAKRLQKDWLTDQPDQFLPDDTLTLLCQFTIIPTAGFTIYDKPKFNEIERHLGRDIGMLMEGAKFSDITFDVSGEKIEAHRAILAARSPVFDTLFKYSEAVIPIVDINPEVFRAMMMYVYTDAVPVLKKIAGPLLEVADRFGLDSLKAMCEPVLFDSITTENCAEILRKADMFRAEQLKNSTIEFIAKNFRDVVKSPGYKILERNHAELLTQIILAMEPRAKRVRV